MPPFFSFILSPTAAATITIWAFSGRQIVFAEAAALSTYMLYIGPYSEMEKFYNGWKKHGPSIERDRTIEK